MSTDQDYPEGHDVVLHKGPCDKCGSSDNLVTYADGHFHCFSQGCGNHGRHNAGASLEEDQAVPGGPGGAGVSLHHQDPRHAKASPGLLNPSDFPGCFGDLAKRRLKSATLRKYGYFVGRYAGQSVHVAPYYDQDGELANQKLRFPDKSFNTLKAEDALDLGKCRLFGQQVYGDKYDRMVVITEGELDALSVAQACDFKFPAVSINGGAAAAAKCLKANYLWLDRFSQIVLWFDDDEPGRLAQEECAKLFKVGKVRTARAPGYKDASDLLQDDKPGDVEAAVYAATLWRPKGIVNARERSSLILSPDTVQAGWKYPPCMPLLQEMTGGIFRGAVDFHVAGTGIGKSASLAEIKANLVKQGVKVGDMSFEDTARDSMLRLMSIWANKRLHLIPVPDPGDTAARAEYDEMMRRYHEEAFGSGLVEMFDHETAEWGMDAILGYIRYMAKALGCESIWGDPLSFLIAGYSDTNNIVALIDKAIMELAKLAKELDVHIGFAHHLRRTMGVPHEEGAPTSLNEVRSSGNIPNFASNLIGWERNTQAEGEAWRVTRSRLLKCRRVGRTGIADVLYYGEDGRLVPSPIPFPPVGKPEEANDNHGRETHKQSFGPIVGSHKDY